MIDVSVMAFRRTHAPGQPQPFATDRYREGQLQSIANWLPQPDGAALNPS